MRPPNAAILSLTFLIFCCGARQSQTQASPPFFAGKTITIVVGSSAGGVYDIYARLLARHLGKLIPGSPNVVVTTMSGADGEIGAAYVANLAPKDGTYIAATTQTQPLQPILNDASQMNYDPSKVNYLGTPASDISLCVVRSNAPATRFQDMLKIPLIMGGTAANGPLGYLPVVLDNVLGAKFKVVLGYPGIGDIMLAMQRQEIHGLCGISFGTLLPHYANLVRTNQIKIVLQASDVSRPELDAMGIPLTSAFARDEDQRKILSIIYSQEIFARPYFVAAQTPPARLAILRRAFMTSWRDPGLRAEASRMGLLIGPVSGPDIQSLLSRIYSSPSALLKRVKAATRAK